MSKGGAVRKVKGRAEGDVVVGVLLCMDCGAQTQVWCLLKDFDGNFECQFYNIY